MVGVAHIASHRKTEQLAAEVVFETCANNLLAIVKIFGTNKPDYGVDQHRPIAAGDGISAGFESLLVTIVVCSG